MAMLPTNRGFVFLSRAAVAVAFSASILAISGCGREPFGYVKVQGKVSYEDGTLIPASRIVVRFISQAPTPDRKITARPGDAEVHVKTGVFTSVTSHAFGDGIVPGEHKVVIVARGHRSGRIHQGGNDPADGEFQRFAFRYQDRQADRQVTGGQVVQRQFQNQCQ